MSVKIKLAAIGVVALTVMGSMTFASSASAAELSSADEAHFRDVWSRYGVNETVQDALLDKFEATGEWDSLTGAMPVRIDEVESEGRLETVSTFSDGSISVAGQQTAATDAPGAAGIDASIDQCKTIKSSQYDYTRECRVWTNVVVATFAYNVTYYQVQGGNSKIIGRSGLTSSCNGGTCSNQKVVTLRATQSGSNAAQVQGSLTFNAYQGVASRDFWLLFSAKGSSTSASNN